MRRFKSHCDDADNLNMVDTTMLTKGIMIMLVLMMMSMVVLVFVDLGKCRAKSSAVEEGDIIIWKDFQPGHIAGNIYPHPSIVVRMFQISENGIMELELFDVHCG